MTVRGGKRAAVRALTRLEPNQPSSHPSDSAEFARCAFAPSRTNSRLFRALRARPAEFAALAIALTIFVLQQLLRHNSYIDDAFISFRYARNFADGYGLVYNPGSTPVEGYTNFLWVIMLAACHRLGLAVPLAAKLLGGEFGVLTLIALWDLPRRLIPDKNRLIATPVIIALLSVYGVACAEGLETPLLILLMVLLVWLNPLEAFSPARTSAVALVLVALVLTRPDAVLFAIPVVAMQLVVAWLKPERRLCLFQSSLLIVAIVTAAAAAHMLWRHQYYGDWLPNTFYAKAPAMPDGLVGRLLSGLGDQVSGFWGDVGGLVILLWALAGILAVEGARAASVPYGRAVAGQSSLCRRLRRSLHGALALPDPHDRSGPADD